MNTQNTLSYRQFVSCHSAGVCMRSVQWIYSIYNMSNGAFSLIKNFSFTKFLKWYVLRAISFPLTRIHTHTHAYTIASYLIICLSLFGFFLRLSERRRLNTNFTHHFVKTLLVRILEGKSRGYFVAAIFFDSIETRAIAMCLRTHTHAKQMAYHLFWYVCLSNVMNFKIRFRIIQSKWSRCFRSWTGIT